MPVDTEKVGALLTSRGATQPCHRCGKTHFSVLDQYTNLSLTSDLDQPGSIIIGGPSVPVVMAACMNCGAITMHALGVLGLLPTVRGEKK